MVDFKPLDGVAYSQGRHEYARIFHDLRKASADRAKQVYRRLCQEDLFFLLYFCCGKQFINVDYRAAKWWVDRINEVETGPATGTLDIWSRAAGKSTIITFGDTLQRLLRDPDERIGIFSYNRSEAKKFLREHKQAFEGNALLLMWFPEIFWDNPKRQSPKWSEDEGLYLKRKSSAREGSIEAWGLIDSQPTGRHFSHLVYDDVVTRDSVQSDGMLAKVEETYRLSKNLGSDRFTERILGTRYHFSDLYGKLIDAADSGELPLTVRVRPVVEDWPDCERVHLWSAEELRGKAAEMGSSVFSAQVLCTPMDPEHAAFKADHMKFYTELPPGWKDWPKYLLVDPSGWDEKGSAGGDQAAFVVVGTDPLNRWYVLDLERARLAPKGVIDLIFRLDEKWSLRLVAIEKEKYGKTLKYWLESQMRERGWPLKIEEVPVGGRSKHDKIMGLQPLYESGHILVRPDMTPLIEEFRHYGYWASDDCIDALSSGLHVITRRKEPQTRRKPTRPTARNRWGAW